MSLIALSLSLRGRRGGGGRLWGGKKPKLITIKISEPLIEPTSQPVYRTSNRPLFPLRIHKYGAICSKPGQVLLKRVRPNFRVRGFFTPTYIDRLSYLSIPSQQLPPLSLLAISHGGVPTNSTSDTENPHTPKAYLYQLNSNPPFWI